MKKYIKDGKVAVLYSPGYGAGWYSWNQDMPDLLFDPDIVQFVLDHPWAFTDGCDKTKKEFISAFHSRYPDAYFGGWKDLRIEWITIGRQFRISEYDGFESIEYNDDVKWITA